jgi:hypothetical protein
VEAIVWDGTNDDELADLVTRVHGPLPDGVEVTTKVVDPFEEIAWSEKKADADRAGLPFLDERPAVGLHLMIGDWTAYRPEVGEVLVYDPFRPPPHDKLFVLTSDAFAVFYEDT